MSPPNYYILLDTVANLSGRDINVKRVYENSNIKEKYKLSLIRKRGNNKIDTLFGKYHIQCIYRKGIRLFLSAKWFHLSTQIRAKGDIEHAKAIEHLGNGFPLYMDKLKKYQLLLDNNFFFA